MSAAPTPLTPYVAIFRDKTTAELLELSQAITRELLQRAITNQEKDAPKGEGLRLVRNG